MLHVGVVRQGLCRRAWWFHVCVCHLSVCKAATDRSVWSPPKHRAAAGAHPPNLGPMHARAWQTPRLVHGQVVPRPFQPCADAKALSGNVWARNLVLKTLSSPAQTPRPSPAMCGRKTFMCGGFPDDLSSPGRSGTVAQTRQHGRVRWCRERVLVSRGIVRTSSALWS